MSWSDSTVLVAVLLLLLTWWVWVAASRLDRLHRKVSSSRAALDNQLVRRAFAAAELASSGLLDPVSSVLVGEAAWAALAVDGGGRAELLAALPGLSDDVDGSPVQEALDRDMAESELSRTVREVLADEQEVLALRADPLGGELVDALAAAWYRVQLSRRFHNEAVSQTQRMRRKSLVRVMRLHGHAAMPQTVEIDDGWPEAFSRPGER